MDMESPFPNYVRMYVAQYVGKWYLVVVTRETYKAGAVLMMRPFPTYRDARDFQHSHTGR